MPIWRKRLALRIARGLTGFLNFETGLTRGAVPNVEQLLENKVRELGQARERLKEQDQQLSTLNQELGERDRQLSTLEKQLARRDLRIEEFKRRANRNAILQKEKQLISQYKEKIVEIRLRLYALGFVERALEELRNLVADSSQPALRRLAAWELTLWHARQYSQADARRCLELLPVALEDESGTVRPSRAAVVEAECQEVPGDTDAARSVISQALARESHADLFLANANFETSASARLEWINKALQLLGISEVSCDPSTEGSLYDSLRPGQAKQSQLEVSSDVKVSVIVSAYNAEDVIRTALNSVLSQTWTNLEVLVVDDCSTDATVQIVEDYVRRDSRVRLIRADANRGTYIARNLGLREATGEFVTCHDADDWSHPEKIEKQVRHLFDNPAVVGNTSQQVPVTSNLKFYGRGYAVSYVHNNASSFMFRRELVMEAVGYWDCVRFSADNEFIQRVKKVFGDERVVEMPTGPLSFVRQSGSSLSGNATFGVHGGFPNGIRKEYREAYTHFHDTAEDLRYDFPQGKRPFSVPEPMWPLREVKGAERRHFDVILVSDFRFSGGITALNIEEIKAQKHRGRRTGLIHMQSYDSDPFVETNQKVRDLLDGDLVQMLVYGEKVSCEILVLRHPPILQDRQKFVPDVEASHVHVVVDQTPMEDRSNEGKPAYDIKRCEEHLREYFGTVGVWHPTDPSVRRALYKHYAENLTKITLASENWTNVIDVNERWRELQSNTHTSENQEGD